MQGLEQQRSGSISGTEEVRKLLSKARGLCEEQERRRGELQANYKEAFLRATKENWIGAAECWVGGVFEGETGFDRPHRGIRHMYLVETGVEASHRPVRA